MTLDEEICEMKIYIEEAKTRVNDDYRSTLVRIWKCDECKDYKKGSKCEHYNPRKNALPLQ